MPINKKLKRSFVVDTAYWLRGSKQWGALFLKDHKYANMCCLGHIGLQSGISAHELEYARSPENIKKSEHVKIPFLVDMGYFDSNNTLTRDAMLINDHPGITDEERIKKLKALFAQNNINLKFK